MNRNIVIVVGTKGRGSNMANIINACASGACCGRVAGVVAPSADSPALQLANELGVETRALDHLDPEFAVQLHSLLDQWDTGLVCLAGYLRLLPPTVVEAFSGKILNVHPALLPKFGGKGMYGHHVHEAVIAAGETESGCTVHYVTEHYDEGAVILQRRCPVLPDDTPDSLAARVLPLEHEAYVAAINQLLGCP